jgi:thioester reductase-like protein
MHSVLERLEYWVERHPKKLLFAFLDLKGKVTEQYTYEDFLQRIDGIGGHLRAKNQFRDKDRLLLAYPAGLEMICAFFGCVRAGLIPVPVCPPTTQGFQAALSKMAHIACDCSAAGLLTSQDFHDSLATYVSGNEHRNGSAAVGLYGLKRLVTTEIRDPAGSVRFSPSDIVFLQYTSGSTDRPKGVMVTHDNLLHNCNLVAHHSSLVGVSWLPQYHDMGLIGYYINAVLSGSTTYGFAPIDFIQRPGLWLDSITKYKASATSAPNFAFEYCLRPGRIPQRTLETIDLSSLEILMVAAEPVQPDIYQRFQQVFEPRGLRLRHFYAAYGLAENTLAVSSAGRTVLSVNKRALSLRKVRVTTEVSEVSLSKLIVSCGKVLGDIRVCIVDPDRHVALEDRNVGEIWISGRSKCLGYWNNPELTRKTFHARLVGDTLQDGYLRTGDLGFFHKGELYVCGRTKDMIIIRGQNYYPQDIERAVEAACPRVRPTCVASFEIGQGTSTALAVVAEVRSAASVPDPRDIVTAIRKSLGIEAAVVALVAPKSVSKTSSGKLSRQLTRQMWLEGKIEVLRKYERGEGSPTLEAESESFCETLKTRYQLNGSEPFTLVDAGVDSLDLVCLMHEIKEMLKQCGTERLAARVDIGLLQHVSITDLFHFVQLVELSPEKASEQMERSMLQLLAEQQTQERDLMTHDRKLTFVPNASMLAATNHANDAVLLTGGTGFVGPFLIRSLLEQTAGEVVVLIRAPDHASAKTRLWEAFGSTGDCSERLSRAFDQRVIAICGDLARPGLGLSDSGWGNLAARIGAIYHNAAAVNYLHNYRNMREANVTGTNEVVRLACESRPKVLNYISTTFIFGWAVKKILYETDRNDDMELLNFGYSQSKWVAEQVIFDAAEKGLATRIFRPALVSPSVEGYGNNYDIAIRLIAFMINHGITVDTLNQVSFVPVDIAANNIVAISRVPGTLNSVYHVTRDEYANMQDITRIITHLTGRRFRAFSLPDFVPAVISRCTQDDLLYPLLDFLYGSVDSIASMEFKRYDNARYREARSTCPHTRPDPSLEDTIGGILRYMSNKGIISVGVRSPNGAGALEMDDGEVTAAYNNLQMGFPNRI